METKTEVVNILNMIADMIANRVVEQVRQMPDATKQADSGRKLYTIKQVCDMLHISKSKLYRHKKEGRLVPTINIRDVIRYLVKTPLIIT